MSNTFVNLTPHTIVLFRHDGTSIDIPPSGEVARVAVDSQPLGYIDGVPIVAPTFGPVSCGEYPFPPPTLGVVYLVSGMVADALRRPDVLAPDTSPDSVVRDADGRIVGVRRLRMGA